MIIPFICRSGKQSLCHLCVCMCNVTVKGLLICRKLLMIYGIGQLQTS